MDRPRPARLFVRRTVWRCSRSIQYLPWLDLPQRMVFFRAGSPSTDRLLEAIMRDHFHRQEGYVAEPMLTRIALFLTSVACLWGQATPEAMPQRGLVPMGTFSVSELETIN